MGHQQGSRGTDRSDAGLSRALPKVDAERLAKGLGWFSIGLGLTQLLAPGRVARLAGVKDTGGTRTVLRLAGLRELGHGAGIFAQRRPAGAVWTRVGGDAMDLALLGRALASGRSERGRVAATTVAVLGVTAADLLCARQLSRRRNGAADGSLHSVQVVTVNRSPEEVYRFWRDFQNLPRFMVHLESVEATGGARSHWKAKGPAGRTVEWDAEITQDRPNELIAWRSLPGADVENSGTVRFTRAPGGRGTEVRVELRYTPPGGGVGATIAKLFGENPEQQARDDLRRFKQVIETGEVVRSEGSPDGMNVGKLMKQRPAQPLPVDGAREPQPAGR
jgi:uncharacterized membrane protein